MEICVINLLVNNGALLNHNSRNVHKSFWLGQAADKGKTIFRFIVNFSLMIYSINPGVEMNIPSSAVSFTDSDRSDSHHEAKI